MRERLTHRQRSPVVYLYSLVLLLLGCGRSDKKLFDGLKSYRDQNFTQAFVLLGPEAEAGKEPAELVVGVMAALGKGIPKDVTTAGQWFDKVQSDRLESRYEEVVGSSAAEEIKNVLTLYRNGKLTQETAMPASVVDASNYEAPTVVTSGGRFESPVDRPTPALDAPSTEKGRAVLPSAPAPLPGPENIPPPPPVAPN